MTKRPRCPNCKQQLLSLQVKIKRKYIPVLPDQKYCPTEGCKQAILLTDAIIKTAKKTTKSVYFYENYTK